MTSSASPAWESAARAKLIEIDAEHAAARARYGALSDRVASLESARNLKAAHLASLLQRSGFTERQEDRDALTRALESTRKELSELDRLIAEAVRQRNAAEQAAQPAIRLRERCKKLLLDLGVLTTAEV